MYVMDAQQMRARRLLGRHMVDVSSRDPQAARRPRPTARASALGGDGRVVVGVAVVAQVHVAGWGHGVSEARGARRPHAVEHVGAERDRDDEVIRVALLVGLLVEEFCG